jgi:hypothetical protein
MLRRRLPRPNFLEKFMSVWRRVAPPSFFADGLSQGIEFFLGVGNNTDALPKGGPTATADRLVERKPEIISFTPSLRPFSLWPA